MKCTYNFKVMKIIEVFKTDKQFKVVTLYQLESGSYISSLPISILDINCPKEELLDQIKNSLNSSRNISSKEETKLWLGNELLKHLKVPSFKKLYTTSSSCNVVLNEKEIKLTPLAYDTKIKALVETDSTISFDEIDFERVSEYLMEEL